MQLEIPSELIVRRVLNVTQPEKIILFGSAARGEIAEGSDIDLLVVVPEGVNNRTLSVEIGDSLRGLGIPVDVVVISSQRYEQTRHISGSIAYPAHTEGSVLYEAA